METFWVPRLSCLGSLVPFHKGYQIAHKASSPWQVLVLSPCYKLIDPQDFDLSITKNFPFIVRSGCPDHVLNVYLSLYWIQVVVDSRFVALSIFPYVSRLYNHTTANETNYLLVSMTICHCISHKCGEQPDGVELDVRTKRDHDHKDRSLLADSLEKDSQRALDDQIEAIGRHLAAVNLAGTSAASLASSSGSHIQVNIASNAPFPSSCQQVIQALLQRLSEIEDTTDQLAARVDNDLEHFHSNLTSKPLLRTLRAECCQILADLHKITNNAPPVTVMKASIESRVNVLKDRLHNASHNGSRPEGQLCNGRQHKVWD